MEPTQQNHQPSEDANVGSCGGGAKGSFLCRQSSTRWTPTTEQIRILKDLYYNNGIRSPNADQIQRISARLRQYGKIEGKNVFYWFQNHKARERQKKRFTSDHHLVPTTNSPSPTTTTTNLQQQQQQQLVRNNKFSTIVDSSTAPPDAAATWKPDSHDPDIKFPISITASAAGFATASSSLAGVASVGQIASYGFASKTMEKSFRECSISSQASSTIGGSRSQSYGWIASNTAYDTYRPPSYGFCEYKPRGLEHYEDTDQEEEQEAEDEEACEVETLPLFPMHNEEFNGGYFSNNFKSPSSSTTSNSNYYFSNNGGSYTSLELSLNSLFGHSPDAL